MKTYLNFFFKIGVYLTYTLLVIMKLLFPIYKSGTGHKEITKPMIEDFMSFYLKDFSVLSKKSHEHFVVFTEETQKTPIVYFSYPIVEKKEATVSLSINLDIPSIVTKQRVEIEIIGRINSQLSNNIFVCLGQKDDVFGYDQANKTIHLAFAGQEDLNALDYVLKRGIRIFADFMHPQIKKAAPVGVLLDFYGQDSCKTLDSDSKTLEESELKAKDNENARLKEENIRLTEENARLQNEKAKLQDEKAKLQEENARLRGRLTSAEEELEDEYIENWYLSGDVDDLHENLFILDKQVIYLKNACTQYFYHCMQQQLELSYLRDPETASEEQARSNVFKYMKEFLKLPEVKEINHDVHPQHDIVSSFHIQDSLDFAMDGNYYDYSN